MKLLRAMAGMPLPWGLRRRLLAASGVSVGKDAYVGKRAALDGGPISIGEGAFLNRDVMIDAVGPVSIGARVSIGPRVTIMASDHDLGDADARAGDLKAGAVTIGDGTWVGAHSVIYGNVTIGEGCVIATGAVVRSDLPAHGVYGGVPAKLLKQL